MSETTLEGFYRVKGRQCEGQATCPGVQPRRRRRKLEGQGQNTRTPLSTLRSSSSFLFSSRHNGGVVPAARVGGTRWRLGSDGEGRRLRARGRMTPEAAGSFLSRCSPANIIQRIKLQNQKKKKKRRRRNRFVYMPEVSHFLLKLDIFLLFFLLSLPCFGLSCRESKCR